MSTFDEIPHEFISDEEREQQRVEQAQFAADLRARQSHEFWQAVFATEVGRREMMAMLNEMHAFQPNLGFSPNGLHCSEATWTELGAQLYGLKLYHRWIKHHTEAVIKMHVEADQ